MTEPKFTKGPWRWEVNMKHKVVTLCGGARAFDNDVLRFQRWGMQGAQPTFCEPHKIFQGVKSSDLVAPVKGREHHSDWFQTINHPDAALIATSPQMYADIEQQVKLMRKIMEELPLTSDIFMEAADRVVELENTLAEARGEQ